MKTRLFAEKLPKLMDYALAIVINSVPGMAESDGGTKQLYQSITKELLSQELKSKRRFASRQFRALTGKKEIQKIKNASAEPGPQIESRSVA